MKWKSAPNLQFFVALGFAILCYVTTNWWEKLFYGLASFVTIKKAVFGNAWWNAKHQRPNIPGYNKVEVKWLPKW